MDKLFTVSITGLKDTWPIKFISHDHQPQYQDDWNKDGLSITANTIEDMQRYLESTKDNELFGVEFYGSSHTWEVETRIPADTVNKMMYDGLKVGRILMQVEVKEKGLRVVS